MPNWCTCELTVSGPPEVLERFKTFAEGESLFDFKKIYPMPSDPIEQHRQTEVSDVDLALAHLGLGRSLDEPDENAWYHWRMSNWGTKWDLNEDGVQVVADFPMRWVIRFDTADNPPTGVVEHAAELFPKLTFDLKYDEPDTDSRGKMRRERKRYRRW